MVGVNEPAGPEHEAEAAATSVAVPAPAFGALGGATAEARILALQRTAGNAAVQRLIKGRQLSRATSGRRLMRFVGWEHERLGNLGSIAQCTASDPSQCPTSALLIEVAPGVKLTWGQVVALAGDEFGSVEEMQFYAAAAGPGGVGDDETRGRLRAAMGHDLGSRPSGTVAIPPGIYNGGTKASSANETHFAELAMHNLEHFPDQGAATEAWRRHHHAAVVEAVLAGLGTAGFTLNHAYLLEAFGDHFLTDCFSAGHIRTPRTQIYRWYEQTWRPAAKTGIKFFLLGQYLQHQFVSPERMVELMKTYGPYLDLALDKLLEKLTPAVSGAVSGTIHDYEGATGVLVSAPMWLGGQFTTYGDDSLPGSTNAPANKTSGTAEKLAVAAIGVARGHIDQAFRAAQQAVASGSADPRGDAWATLDRAGVKSPYTEILNFVPRAVPGATPMPWAKWRWGAMDKWMHDKVNAYAASKIDSKRAGIVGAVPDFTLQINDGPEMKIRQVIDDALKAFAADPLGVIGRLIMWEALDPALAPAPATSGP